MKRITCLLFVCLMTLSLVCCGRGQVGPQETASPENTAAQHVTEAPKITDAPETHVPDHSYNKDTDFNKMLATNGNEASLLESEDVYYWKPYLGNLIYAEKDGSDYGPLCGRPECTHEDSSCDAHVAAYRFMALTGGKLYYFNVDLWRQYPDACGVICRMDLDGTNKEIVKPVPKPETLYGDGGTPQYVCFHRGILYLFYHANFMSDAEPMQPFMVYAFPLDGDEIKLIYDSGKDYHDGSIFPSGEFCYIQDYVWNEAGEYKDKILRWSSVTGETELLYEGEDFRWIARYWVDEEGTVYTNDIWTSENGTKNVMRLNDGKWEKAFDFEDPDISYSIRNLSDGIVIARNHIIYSGLLDPDIDIWIKRYDGSTVYKGKLPMTWVDAYKEQGMTLEGCRLVCGNENELFCEFELRKRNKDRVNEPQSNVLIKYALKDGDIEEMFLGDVYHEIKQNW